MTNLLKRNRFKWGDRIVWNLWRVLVSPGLLVVSWGLLLVWAALSFWVPQVPARTLLDPARYAQWMAAMRSGGVAPLALSLGLHRLFDSRLADVLLAFAGVATVIQLLYLWMPGWIAPAPRRAHIEACSLPESEEQAWQHLYAAAGRNDWAWSHLLGRDGISHAQAQRSGAARWGQGLFFAGLVVLICGISIGQRQAWQGDDTVLVLGETVYLDPARKLAARLEEIQVVPPHDGQDERVTGVLSFPGSGQGTQRLLLNASQRATVDGLAVYQTGYEPAARLSVRGADGTAYRVRSIEDGTSATTQRVRFPDQQQEQSLTVPSAGLVIRLVHYATLPAQGIQGRALHVQVYDNVDGVLIAEQFMAGDGVLVVNGASVEIGMEYALQVKAQREPSLVLVLLAGGLVLVGTISAYVWPPRRLWVVLQGVPEGTGCQICVRRADAAAPWFKRLCEQLQSEDPSDS